MVRSKKPISPTQLLGTRLRIGCIFGTLVSIHWSWFLFLVLWTVWAAKLYSSWPWAVAQFIGTFILLMLHELGHIGAARLFGRQSKEIILWPLGGFAIVDYSQRWRSQVLIASAGPAVNIVLVPIVFLLWHSFDHHRWSDANDLLWRLGWTNMGLAIFNLLPIWPLDGGRITQAAMAARLGLTRSRFASGIAGMGFALGVGTWLIYAQEYIGAALLSIAAWMNVSLLRWSLAMLAAERRFGFDGAAICPHCGSRALAAPTMRCTQCGELCNPLMTRGHCWKCKSTVDSIRCRYCGEVSEVGMWLSKEEPVAHSKT